MYVAMSCDTSYNEYLSFPSTSCSLNQHIFSHNAFSFSPRSSLRICLFSLLLLSRFSADALRELGWIVFFFSDLLICLFTFGILLLLLLLFRRYCFKGF